MRIDRLLDKIATAFLEIGVLFSEVLVEMLSSDEMRKKYLFGKELRAVKEEYDLQHLAPSDINTVLKLSQQITPLSHYDIEHILYELERYAREHPNNTDRDTKIQSLVNDVINDKARNMQRRKGGRRKSRTHKRTLRKHKRNHRRTHRR